MKKIILKDNHPFDYDQKQYTVNIHIHPMPNNCYECPFYYLITHDDGEFHTCFLITMEDSRGIALERHKDCPLNRQMGALNE